MDITYQFAHLFFMGLIALFPVINPIGSAFVVSPYFSRLDDDGKQKAATVIAVYAFGVCTVSLFFGQWILKLFGLSIPVIQLGGGIMICKMGWGFLAADQRTDDQKTGAQSAGDTGAGIADQLFYPLTFPVTTGAGTVSVLCTLSAHSAHADMRMFLVGTAAILAAIVVMCIMVYVFYVNTKSMIQCLGGKGALIVNQLSAFLIFCVGLQIGVSGLLTLFKV